MVVSVVLQRSYQGFKTYAKKLLTALAIGIPTNATLTTQGAPKTTLPKAATRIPRIKPSHNSAHV